MKGKKLFNDVVFELFKDDDNYEKISFQMNKAFDMFFNDVPSFKNMETKTQYYIIRTALLIKIGADSRGTRIARILTRPKPSNLEKNYDVEFGFKEVSKLELSNQKLIE